MPPALPTPVLPTRRPRTPPAHPHCNADGDLVVAAGIGEVVLLPRLWGFDFRVAEDGSVVSSSPSGLLARAEPTADGAIRLTEATAHPARSEPLRAEAS